MKTNRKLLKVAALGLGAIIAAAAPIAMAQNFNPYGASVSGTLTSNAATQAATQYVGGDTTGSGPVTATASNGASLAGANATSSSDVLTNKIGLSAQTNTPFLGTVGSATATANGSMWDTVTFSGGSASEIGTFVLTGTSFSDGVFGTGNGNVTIYNGSLILSQSSFTIIPGSGNAQFTINVNIPVNTTLQIVENATVSASSNNGGALPTSTTVTLDPSWSFLLPQGVSITSASGTAYLTTAVPEPSTYALTLVGLGLLSLAVRRRKLFKG